MFGSSFLVYKVRKKNLKNINFSSKLLVFKCAGVLKVVVIALSGWRFRCTTRGGLDRNFAFICLFVAFWLADSRKDSTRSSIVAIAAIFLLALALILFVYSSFPEIEK